MSDGVSILQELGNNFIDETLTKIDFSLYGLM